MPFFSVIIPCYNAESWLSRGLDSLENQTFRDFEVVLVDDCSTDGTYDYLLNYQSGSSLSVRILRNQENSGPGVSRESGIRESSGEYIAFLDSDDWYEADYLEEMFSRIRRTGADVVFCDFYRDSGQGKKQWIKCTSCFSAGTSLREYVALCYDSLCVLTARRTLFDVVSMPALYNAEDTALVPLLVASSSVVSYVPRPLYHYFSRPDSLSTRRSEKIALSFSAGFRFLEGHLPAGYEPELVFRGIKMVVYGVVYNALRSGMSREQFVPLLRDFQQTYPDWYSNPYIVTLPKRKVFFLWCVKHGFFLPLKFYCCFQDFLLHRNK